MTAALLGQRFDIPAFHTDDYYLPFRERPDDWRGICAGNMDIARFRSEVLVPLSSGEPVHTYRYRCHEDRRETDDREPLAFAVVEESYSCHPERDADLAVSI